MGRQGWKDVLVTPEVHTKLNMLKAELGLRNHCEVIKYLLKQLRP